ncbi:hypothetical protein GCM10010377_42780 [Streptomyces viridiviolaceus]|nr:hypothetical protein GCM10010377_42780 [Streptomyces viridiviolaceus]
MHADAIVPARHVETLAAEASGPSANAVAIVGGRIVAVGDMTESADPAARGRRTRGLLDHGAVVALGSDRPIGPGDPRIGLADCRLRRPVEEPGTAPVRPAQAISAREVYTGMTGAAAHAAGASHDLGRIAPGHLADLTVLAANTLDLAPEAQPGDTVLAAVVGGAVQHHTNSAEGNP